MLRASRFALAMALLPPIGGCASEEQEKAATAAYVECLRGAAHRLDDHTSDALTIAIAMQPLCSAEMHNVQETWGSGMSLDAYQSFERRVANESIQLATTVVMEERQRLGTAQ
jgi:hypothetical protein